MKSNQTLHHVRNEHSVVFDGRFIQDRYHGIGRYGYHVISELAGLLPELRMMILRDPAADESRFNWNMLASRPNVNVCDIQAPVFSLREQIAIPAALRGRRKAATTYHTPYFALPWLPAVANTIVTVHDCIFEHHPGYMPRRWARLYYALLMHASTRRARYVAVPSRGTALDLRRFYRVPKRKILVTPEAADPAFRPLADHTFLKEVRNKYKLPERFVLAVGARRPHKNFALLVRAVERVKDAQLVFVGNADERFPDDAGIAAEALAGRVHFAGKISEEELVAFYNLATIVASPSLIEGFGLPVLEAMACGTPVICSDIPVFREVAGSAAMYASPHDLNAWIDVLKTMIESESLRADLSKRGLEHSRRFSWRAAAEALVPAYK